MGRNVGWRCVPFFTFYKIRQINSCDRIQRTCRQASALFLCFPFLEVRADPQRQRAARQSELSKFRLLGGQAMAYNKARAEQEWLEWKESEEKKLRELGVDENTIQRLHT